MKSLHFLITALFFFVSCTNKAPEQAKVTPEKENPTSEIIQEDVKYYSWLDGLNVRESPNLNAKVVGKINPTDPLLKTGKTSADKVVIVLRGLAYKDYWYEVETPEHKTAWVFGGAIKSTNEEKGNPPNSELKFNFPSFGAFNLHNWKQASEEDSNNADATYNTKIYLHPSEQRKMVITKTDLGEHGYAVNHQLLGIHDKPILSRQVRFDNEKKTLTEEVVTHNMYPKRKATRTQEIGVSYLELNDRPILTQGEWHFENVE